MKEHDEFSKNELINKINGLERTIELLRAEKNQYELLNFPWVGNLGNWHWNIKENSVICNDEKILALNYSRKEIPEQLDFDFFTSKVHPDHYEEVMENMKQHLKGNTPAYEVEYKIATKDGKWKWYYDRGVVSQCDDNGKAMMLSGIVFDVTHQKEREWVIEEQNDKLWDLLHTDYLTGAINRRALFKNLGEHIEKANQNKLILGTIMIDVDNFKKINDSYGHITGDEALIKIVDAVKSDLDPTDSIGRYGGEEFLVILPGKDEQQSMIIAEKIRTKIEQLNIGSGCNTTISCGVKAFDNEEIDTLVDKADKALY